MAKDAPLDDDVVLDTAPPDDDDFDPLALEDEATEEVPTPDLSDDDGVTVVDEEPDFDGTPEPIHPSSSPEQIRARTTYERNINAEAEAFRELAFTEFIGAKVAGRNVSLVIWAEDDEDFEPVLHGDPLPDGDDD